MTLPQILFASISVWLFIVIGTVIAAYRESKLKLKQAQHAHKAEQPTIDPDELEALPELDDIDWRGLGVDYCERPYVKMR